jgi:hypothetical protein
MGIFLSCLTKLWVFRPPDNPAVPPPNTNNEIGASEKGASKEGSRSSNIHPKVLLAIEKYEKKRSIITGKSEKANEKQNILRKVEFIPLDNSK